MCFDHIRLLLQLLQHLSSVSYLRMERRGVQEGLPLAKQLLAIDSSW